MDNQQIFVYCKKNDVRFGDIYFQKGQVYPAAFVHDLVWFKGELGNIVQIEDYASNDYFQEFFTLVFSMTATQATLETQEKIHA